ncbi:probable cysteine protease RD19B [Benincasa hispida]|uniref:probable cysteine protease RD19B n=1 Tax=Benincasa hispida TaxID=102211 RepID=UPI0019012423|nr:probable cysteine protease RD19B [Benincasa hispida]
MDWSFSLFAVIAAATATLCSSESLTSPRSIERDGDPLIRQVVDDGNFNNRLPLGAEHHFSLFKQRFGKSYATEEEHDRRFKIFEANMRRAQRHQSFDPSAIHGITQFSDLTPFEFRKAFLGLRGHRLRLPVDTNAAPILPTENLPIDFDWRERGAVTPVKNQGSCGSCWSFSTTGALEGANFLATGELVSLSEQQLVDCDHECDPEEADSCDSGCNGGLMNSAFEYTLKAGGLMREEDYPYTGTDRGNCNFDKSKIAASVANFSVVSLDEDQIAANLVKNGPLAIAINAVFMQTYIGGVSCPFICSRRLDHGVLLVGYGSAGYAPIRMRDKDYWIIKNSWGENWGENGYYKICRGRNICGVDSLVSTVAAVHTHDTSIAAAGQ